MQAASASGVAHVASVLGSTGMPSAPLSHAAFMLLSAAPVLELKAAEMGMVNTPASGWLLKNMVLPTGRSSLFRPVSGPVHTICCCAHSTAPLPLNTIEKPTMAPMMECVALTFSSLADARICHTPPIMSAHIMPYA